MLHVKATLHCMKITLPLTFARFGPLSYLRVDIQDAGASHCDHLVNAINLCAVQVAVVLAVLQEAAGLHISLHLCP